MVTEDYVSFELAKLLQRKGFGREVLDDGTYAEECRNSYDLFIGELLPHCAKHGGQVNAPTLQVAMKWLRDVHGIHLGILITYQHLPRKYEVHIMRLKEINDIVLCPNEDFNTYEEACEAGIRYCLENLI